MKRLLIILLFVNCFVISALAQNVSSKYLEDKYSWYLSLNLGNAIGKYQKTLKDANKAGPKGGLALGGLINPYKRKKSSTVFYGAEVGFQSDGQDDIVNNTQSDFFVSNNFYWLNGVARYRPILWSSKINPYADAFFGAKLIKTNVVEQISQDERQTFKGFSKVVPNYGFGVGAGIKLTGQLKNSYLDVGLYYQQADPTKIIKRNSIDINSSYVVSYKQIVTPTNQIIVKIGLTGFI
jgi:hypothetical protein